jgi:hypothetical protein
MSYYNRRADYIGGFIISFFLIGILLLVVWCGVGSYKTNSAIENVCNPFKKVSTKDVSPWTPWSGGEIIVFCATNNPNIVEPKTVIVK